jgi:hypothetical protein
MAPELLKEYNAGDGPIPDLTKADIFSLGISIYELMINEKLPPNGKLKNDFF